MHILSIILLGIAANLDNLGIGLAYGIRRVRVPFGSNLIIAVLSGVATTVTCIGGHFLSRIIAAKIGNLLGGSIVAAVGVWVIITFFLDKRKASQPGFKAGSQAGPGFGSPDDSHHGCRELPPTGKELSVDNLRMIVREPIKADMDYSGHISVKEAILLGAALAVNCLATGLGAGLTGLNALGMAVSVILFSVVTIGGGAFVGRRYAASCLGEYAALVAGLLLITVGIYEMIV